MAEEAKTAVVEEKPPVVETPTEEQITEDYLEQRKEGKTTDLPVPPPTIPEKPIEKPAEEKPSEDKPPVVEMTDQQAVDRYLEERQEKKEKKRRERSGAQARIDQLTKEKAELEAKIAEAAKVPPPVEVPKPTEPPKPVEATPAKEKPKMADYTDVDEYHAAMALWAANERAKSVTSKDETREIKSNGEAARIAQIRKEEFDNFLEVGKRFIASHPDFNTTLEAAHVRGLTMSEAARREITRKAAPNVAYWLAKPENDLIARKFMQMDEMDQLVEVGRIIERLAVSPTDFVSNAPAPGPKLAGGYVAEVPLNQIQDTDEYIRRRKQERRAGRGR